MSIPQDTRPPLPPFTRETASKKVRMAEDGWNTREPEKIALAYTPDSIWRNRAEFLSGREEIIQFLTRKWVKEIDNLRATTPPREVYEMTRKVSQYALEDKSELFAEIHSGVMIGKEASIPKPLLEMYYRALGG